MTTSEINRELKSIAIGDTVPINGRIVTRASTCRFYVRDADGRSLFHWPTGVERSLLRDDTRDAIED
jgi:hypothetical protein